MRKEVGMQCSLTVIGEKPDLVRMGPGKPAESRGKKSSRTQENGKIMLRGEDCVRRDMKR